MKELEPGRELDELVAEKVLGWKRVTYGNKTFPESYCPKFLRFSIKGQGLAQDTPALTAQEQADRGIYYDLPPYSTSIEAAWEVVEKLNDDNFILKTNGSGWTAYFWDHGRTAETVPHAICLAALRLVNQQT